MKKYILFLIIVIYSFSLFSQTLVSKVKIDSFPEVSFTLNYYNPEIKQKSEFIVSEDGKNIDFNLTKRIQNAENEGRTVLFLLEDMNHNWHRGQTKFFKEFIIKCFKEINVGSKDKFNVAIFDRKDTNEKSPIHTWVLKNFSGDYIDLGNRLLIQKSKYNTNSKQKSSELYTSMAEALDEFQKADAHSSKMLVVLSAGRNLDNVGGKNDAFELENKALKLKIPIYAIKYPVAGCTHCTGLDQIVKNTFGKFVQTRDLDNAVENFLEYFNNINKRSKGVDYTFFYKTSDKKNGQQRIINVTLGGVTKEISFYAPEQTFKDWIFDNLIVAVFIIISAVILIFLVIIYMIRLSKRKKELENINKQKENQIEIDNKKHQNEIEQKEKELKLVNEKIEKEKKLKIQAENEENRLAELVSIMKNLNKIPRLQCRAGDNNFIFNIEKPEVTIGRNSSNDIVLDSLKVSGKHAEIMFNGTDFYIHDLNSTNKTKVNNEIVEKHLLKNADSIKLGDAVITFFV